MAKNKQHENDKSHLIKFLENDLERYYEQMKKGKHKYFEFKEDLHRSKIEINQKGLCNH